MSGSWLLRQQKEIELACTKGPPSLSWFCHSLFQIYRSKSLSKTECRFPHHSKTVEISAEHDKRFVARVKVKRFLKVGWIRSHHLHLLWKFKLWARKFDWGVKAKYYWALSWYQKFCWHHPAMLCLCDLFHLYYR